MTQKDKHDTVQAELRLTDVTRRIDWNSNRRNSRV